MCSRPQFTDLTYIGGTGPCGPMTIIFVSVIKSLQIKFGANCSFHVPKIPVYQFGLYGGYQILWTDIAHFQYQPAYGSLCGNFQVCSSLRSDAIVFTTYGRTDGRTDRHSSNVLEFCADQMSPRNIGSQIFISRCYKRIDKTNIPSLRRVS